MLCWFLSALITCAHVFFGDRLGVLGREDDSLAIVKHVILFVQVHLCYLWHLLIQREHQVVFGEAGATTVTEVVSGEHGHVGLGLELGRSEDLLAAKDGGPAPEVLSIVELKGRH